MRDPAYTAAAELLITALEAGRVVEFRVESDSMWPYFPVGTLLEVDPVRPEKLHFGDCVLYVVDSEIWVHRLVGFGQSEGGRYFRTKGDHRLLFDGRIPADRLIGRVRAFRRPNLASKSPHRTIGIVLAAGSFSVGCLGALWRRFSRSG